MMNDKIFKQYEDPWKDLPYPTYSSDFGENGCGCCACTHIAIEQESKKDWTPENLRQWMIDQGYVVSGHGTEWQGIYDTLKHIGHDTVVWVKKKDPMSMAWEELDKGNRIGVMLVNDGSTPDHTVWTTDGHYISFNKYWKDEQGNHWFNIKDSGWRNHDGEFCYERSLMHALPQLWIVERIGKEPGPTPPTPSGEKYTGPYPVVKWYLEPGDRGENVTRLQNYLNWYTDGQFFRECGGADGVYGKNTLRYVNKMLTDFFGASEADGKVGNKAIAKMKAYEKPVKPQPTPTTYTNVIDVSYVQKSIDWAKVKASGIVGAMVRCGYRGYADAVLKEDKMFLDHIKGASKAGLKVGVYFFTEAINYAEGKEEAEFTLDLIKKAGVNLYYPIAVDTEAIGEDDEGIIPRADNISKAARTDAIKGFCDVIKERGGQPMIYASLNWFDTHLDMSKLPFDVWCAQYYHKCEYEGKYLMWQYTSKGSVEGVEGVVDMNQCYITSPAPTPKPTPTPSGGYTGPYPTEAEIRSASNKGIRSRICEWAKQIADSGKYHYKYFENPPAPESMCPICHPGSGDGWNCIGFVWACWHHGGKIPNRCNCYVIPNHTGDGIMESDYNTALAIIKDSLGIDDVTLIRNNGKRIPDSMLEKGDALICTIDGETYAHTALYVGNNKIADSSSQRTPNIKYGATYSNWGCKDAIRYTGSLSYMQKGDEGSAVLKWQDFLNWWSDGQFYKECGAGDTYFGSNTHKWTVKFQKEVMGKGQGDGTVGPKTIAAAQSVRK